LSNLLPYLKITDPNGKTETIELTKTRYTIGRLPECNDIALPETEGIITRVEHCILEREADGWWVKDKSTNGTIIERDQVQLQVQSCLGRKNLIVSEDLIKINNWQLEFIDPNKTPAVILKPEINLGNQSTNLVFNVSQLTLYKIEQGQRIPLELRPQLINMLEYLARKNLGNQNQPTVCTYDELINTIWKDENDRLSRTPLEVNGLAKDIRKIFTKNGGDSSWLETKKTIGYILKITCEN
jgi:DNA-binding winged helix-turn-helix (wHTH) protein